MNSVLQRQLKKMFGGPEKVPENLHALLEVVSRTYDAAEEDRRLIERSMELSSKEMNGLNARLQEESATLKTKLDELARINKLMVDRELKMIELKKEIEVLKSERATAGTQ